MKKINKLIGGLTAIFLVAGISTFSVQAASIPKINHSSLTMTAQTSSSLKLNKVSGSRSVRNTIRWSTSNKNIVSFSGTTSKKVNVKVNARKKGSAIITAKLKYNGQSYRTLKCRVNVLSAPKLNKSSMSLTTGQTSSGLYLKSLTGSKKVTRTIRWTTSNSDVVKFSGSTAGKIKPKLIAAGEGTATVTGKVKADGTRWTLLKCKIKVTDPKPTNPALYPGITISAARRQVTSNNSFYNNLILNETNEIRKSNGLPTLKYSQKLTEVAAYRAMEIAKSRKMDHTRRNGYTFKDLASKGFGYHASLFDTENLGCLYTTADGAFTGTYNYYGTKQQGVANALKDNTHIGIAYAIGSNGVYYFVQIFGNDV